MKTEKIQKYKQTESRNKKNSKAVRGVKMVQTNATDTNCKAMDAKLCHFALTAQRQGA